MEASSTGSRMGYMGGVRGGSGKGTRRKKKNSATHPTVQLNRIIDNAIVKDTYIESFFSHDTATEVMQTVDFDDRDPDSMWNNHYTIWFADKMPSDRSVVFLFPNHPVPKLQVLRASKISSLDSLGRAINDRFRESHEHTERGGNVRIAMAYGNHIYVFCNVKGTLYLAWARQITKSTPGGGLATSVGHMCPVILNMEGSMVGKRIFLPKADVEDGEADLRTIMFSIKQSGDGTLRAGKWPKMLININTIPRLFVCERDTRRQPKTKLTGLTEEEVLKRMANSSGAADRNRAARRERTANPFAASVDQEEDLVDDGHYYYEDDDSSSMEVLPMHRSAVGGQIIHEDGTRSLGDLTLAPVRSGPPSIYPVVRETAISDPGVPDCGTHRPRSSNPTDSTFAARGRRGSLSIIAPSSGEESDDTTTGSGNSTPHSGGTRARAYVEVNPWDSSNSTEDGEEEEEEEEEGDEEVADDERLSLTQSRAAQDSE